MKNKSPKLKIIVIFIIIVIFCALIGGLITFCGWEPQNNKASNQPTTTTTKQEKKPQYKFEYPVMCATVEPKLISVDNTGLTFELKAILNSNTLQDCPFQNTVLNMSYFNFKNQKLHCNQGNDVYPSNIKLYVNGNLNTDGIITFLDKDETKTIKIECTDAKSIDDYANFTIGMLEKATYASSIKGKPKNVDNNGTLTLVSK